MVLSPEQVIANLGLPAIFIGSAVEGDLTPLLGGVVSHLGVLRLPLVALVAAIGMLAGDLCWYWLGRSRGDQIRASKIYRKSAGAVESYVDRLGAAQLLTARFVYGTRIASMIYWGVRGLPVGRFLAIDTVGCVVWTAVLSGLGYVLSDRAAAIIGEVKAIERWLLGAVAIALLLAVIRAATARRQPAD